MYNKMYPLIPVERMRQRLAKRIFKRKLANNHLALVSFKRTSQPLPEEFSLCQYSPFIFDQGQVGSCTANAAIMMYMMERIIQGGYPQITFSRRWLYFMERFREALMQNNGLLPPNWYDLVQSQGYIVSGDNGAYAQDGIEIISQYGCPPESDYPYIGISGDPRVNAIPPESLKEKARMHIPSDSSVVYVDTIDGRADGPLFDPRSMQNSIKNELYVNKQPVLVGFQCYAPDENSSPVVLDENGVMQLPPEGWVTVGGHEVLIVGWNDKLNAFLIQNSWGTQFGIQPPGAKFPGYFYMNYNYAFHLTANEHGQSYDMAGEFRTLKIGPGKQPTPVPVPVPVPVPTPDPQPEPQPEPQPDPTPEPQPEPIPDPYPVPPQPITNLSALVDSVKSLVDILTTISLSVERLVNNQQVHVPQPPPPPYPQPQPQPQPFWPWSWFSQQQPQLSQVDAQAYCCSTENQVNVPNYYNSYYEENKDLNKLQKL